MIDANDKDVNTFVEKLVELGGRAPNAGLRQKLGWTQDRYFDVRNRCKAEGLIGLGRGRGGVVFATETAVAEISASELPQSARISSEEDQARETEYYNKILPTLRRDWVENEGFDDFIVEITAAKRVKGAGRWTVPDAVIIGKTVRQYVPGFEFTVQSVEVKRYESIDALAVFEALNHRRSSHYSFLLIVNAPKKPSTRDTEKIGQVAQLCEEHNVGLVIISKGDEPNYDNWDFRVVATDRYEPDPYNLDGFIKQYLSLESKDAVAKMVR